MKILQKMHLFMLFLRLLQIFSFLVFCEWKFRFSIKMETRFSKKPIYFLFFHSKSVNPLTKKLANAIFHIFDFIECSFIVKIQFTINSWKKCPTLTGICTVKLGHIWKIVQDLQKVLKIYCLETIVELGWMYSAKNWSIDHLANPEMAPKKHPVLSHFTRTDGSDTSTCN